MSEITPANAAEWYRKNSDIYRSLSDVVTTTISNLLKSENIDHLGVHARTKALESILNKLERKGYQTTEELTDICGVRIIAYIESDVDRICALISNSFQIHQDKSIDKSSELQINEIGYRSVHYICELGKARVSLPELRQYNGITFEVQVRTVLQHAWAEIEHDRSYKFSGKLPLEIQRRLNLLAGTLEIVDREFNTLAREVDAHKERTKTAVQSGDFRDVELTSAGLSELILSIPDVVAMFGFNLSQDQLTWGLFEELKAFDIRSLKDLQSLLSENFIIEYLKHYKNWPGVSSFLRAAMLYQDAEKFLSQKNQENWRNISDQLAGILIDKHGEEKTKEIFEKYKIRRLSELTNKRIPRTPPPPERVVKSSAPIKKR